MQESEQAAEQVKRPYEAPAITSEQIFETTDLACGKKPAQGGPCIARRKAS